ncbi:hypothetical protein [Haloparvum alkalitolerans]|uniref:hypothetical protein n=1 Tax=Haloparvum alkalitolerans TaxID=1042953 RepID=UPI003CF7A0A0
MATDIAVAVLEISSVFLSLLFVALQYLSRQITGELVSQGLLMTAAEGVANASLLVLASGYLAWILLVVNQNDTLVSLMVALLLIAFAFIAAAIRETAKELADSLAEGNGDANHNTEDEKSTDEEDDL